MSDFEKWSKYNLGYTGKEAFEGGQQSKEAALKECDEVIKLQDADLRKYEKQIESLKAQLNNMEACYIEKKKQVEDALHILDELYRKGLFAKPKAVSEAINVLRGES